MTRTVRDLLRPLLKDGSALNDAQRFALAHLLARPSRRTLDSTVRYEDEPRHEEPAETAVLRAHESRHGAGHEWNGHARAMRARASARRKGAA